MKRTLLTAIYTIALSLLMLTIAICAPVTERVMLPLMEHFAPPEDTGLPAAEYPAVVDMIIDYLAGWNGPFQHIYTVDGSEFAAFNQKEQAHMKDVQALFELCKWVALISASIFGLALHASGRGIAWHAFRRTLLAILAAVTALIILACIDFNSLFVLFHKVAFTNDLWLLNPQTDLLIRLMPIEFFISCAAIIGGIWLVGMVGLLIFATYRIKKMQDKRE